MSPSPLTYLSNKNKLLKSYCQEILSFLLLDFVTRVNFNKKKRKKEAEQEKLTKNEFFTVNFGLSQKSTLKH